MKAVLTCGIFSCPADTPVGTVWYSSLSYDYIVVERDGVKQLVRKPVPGRMP